MLIDTGARDLVVASSVVQELGLKPSGRSQDAHGLVGLSGMAEYEASLLLLLTDEYRKTEWKGFPVYAWQAPDTQIFQPEGAAGPRVIGIIGRILLQYAAFVYDGMNGSFELRLDIDAYIARGKAGGQTGS